MMFNMDMVGRLNPADKGLTIGGIGTSPSFSKAVELANAHKFKINIDSSGMGPSDHSSFYLKNIPVLFYFTGVHADYHKPSDDAHLINYKGMAKIAQLVTKTIHALANGPRPEFRQTAIKETKSVRFKVTLGVMPDYSYSGEGMKIDGVVEGKPAQSAGMKAGDIVTKIGDVDVKGMESYMQALAKYKKGDTVDVVYMRDGQQMIANITF
jgi:aminopeptidase YwaD